MLIPVLVVSISSFKTYSRNDSYYKKILLWEYTARRSFNKTRPHYIVGDAYYEAGRLDESFREFQTAVSVKPDDAEAHFNRGCLFYKLGAFGEAIADFDKAIALNPSYV
jgi:tetratricopeptide (TPR) repeat protein